MTNSRETKVLNCICMILVLLAGMIRPIFKRLENVSLNYNAIIFVLFTAAAFIWMCQLQRRLIQAERRRKLMATAILIIFWMAIRTIKYELVPDGHDLVRYIWYLYYVPQTFGVLLAFLSVLQIGKPYDRPMDKRWNLLYIPAVFIVAIILTNDFHRLAFRFSGNRQEWADHYTHGPFYYIAMLWAAVFLIASLVITFMRCRVAGSRKKIWIPMVPVVAAVLIFANFLIKPNQGIIHIYRVPEICIIIYAAFMESLILAHLIPSNDSYGELWNASSIGAGIMDDNGVICYRSEKSLPVTYEQMIQALSGEVLLNNHNISLQSHAIQAGYGYWTRDISGINRLNKELAELGDVLAQENSMLEAENKIKEKRIRIEEQNKLYDDLARSVKKQIEQLNEILGSLPEEEAEFEKTMKYACILNVYVKRHSNLLLLCHQGKYIHSDELRRALTESLEYVQFYGIKTYGSYRGEGTLPGETVLLAYELFERALEAALPDTGGVLIYMELKKETLCLRMEFHAPRETLPKTCMHDEIQNRGGEIQIENDGETSFITLTVPTGGESA